ADSPSKSNALGADRQDFPRRKGGSSSSGGKLLAQKAEKPTSRQQAAGAEAKGAPKGGAGDGPAADGPTTATVLGVDASSTLESADAIQESGSGVSAAEMGMEAALRSSEALRSQLMASALTDEEALRIASETEGIKAVAANAAQRARISKLAADLGKIVGFVGTPGASTEDLQQPANSLNLERTEAVLGDFCKILSQSQREADCHLILKLHCARMVVDICVRVKDSIAGLSVASAPASAWKLNSNVMLCALKFLGLLCKQRLARVFLLLTSRVLVLADVATACLDMHFADALKPQDAQGGPVLFLPQLLHVLSLHTKQSLPEGTGDKQGTLAGYLLLCGLAEKLRELFRRSEIRGLKFFDGASPVPLLLLRAMGFLGTLVSAYRLPAGPSAEALEAHARVLEMFRQTELFGIVGILVSILLSEGRREKGARLPQTVISLAVQALRILNSVARIDLSTLQETLSSGRQQELYHLLVGLLDYCVSRVPAIKPGQSPASQGQAEENDLLQETVVLLGFYCVQQPQNQSIMCYGEGQSLLARLTSLPLHYFMDERGRAILFPTILATCYKSEQNLEILRSEMNLSLLRSFLAGHIAQREEAKQPESVSPAFAGRFPAALWQEALAFLDSDWSGAIADSDHESEISLRQGYIRIALAFAPHDGENADASAARQAPNQAFAMMVDVSKASAKVAKFQDDPEHSAKKQEGGKDSEADNVPFDAPNISGLVQKIIRGPLLAAQPLHVKLVKHWHEAQVNPEPGKAAVDPTALVPVQRVGPAAAQEQSRKIRPRKDRSGLPEDVFRIVWWLLFCSVDKLATWSGLPPARLARRCVGRTHCLGLPHQVDEFWLRVVPSALHGAEALASCEGGWPTIQHRLNQAQYMVIKVLLGAESASLGAGGYGRAMLGVGMKARLGTRVAERIALVRARMLSQPMDSPIAEALLGASKVTGATWMDHAAAVSRGLGLIPDFIEHRPSIELLQKGGSSARLAVQSWKRSVVRPRVLSLEKAWLQQQSDEWMASGGLQGSLGRAWGFSTSVVRDALWSAAKAGHVILLCPGTAAMRAGGESWQWILGDAADLRELATKVRLVGRPYGQWFTKRVSRGWLLEASREREDRTEEKVQIKTPSCPLSHVYMTPSGPEEALAEVIFCGIWASTFCTLGPGDRLLIEGAEESDGAFLLLPRRPSAVSVFRRGCHARIDNEKLEVSDLPAWLRMPNTRQVAGAYNYARFLSNVRDGNEVNVWAVVWENAKPGPRINGNVAHANLILVDKSFEDFNATEWSANPSFPQYSLQIMLQGKPVDRGLEAIPYLAVGDVVRVHRARMSAKPPRYMNLMMQRHSSVVADDMDDRGVVSRAISSSDNTIVAADCERARALQAWIRGRLSSETISEYFVMASELQGDDSHRDLAVQVLEVQALQRHLVVADGSGASERLVVEASQPETAAAWLFLHVRPGQWLKLRSVSFADRLPDFGGSAASDSPGGSLLRVSAANVTRLPEWCLDVQLRRQQLEAKGMLYRAADEAKAPEVAEVRASGDTELDEEDEEQ
ncbi:unnamed protein product, partial [Polarella glacialis]